MEQVFVEVLASMGAPYNPRKISDHDLNALRRSMTEFGCVEPIVCNRRTSQVIGGHQRIKAAQAEGIRHLPVCWVDLDGDHERALNLALNRISGTWDDDALRDLLIGLADQDIDLELTGFDDAELARLLQQIKDGATDDDALPTDVEKRCDVGDLWRMGEHRLLCGDATRDTYVAILMGEDKAELCITDPPYGVAYKPNWRWEARLNEERGTGRRKEIVNDDRSDWSEAWKLFDGDVIYSWTAQGGLSVSSGMALMESGFELRGQLIWRKTNFPLSRGHYTYQHEPCWYAVRKGCKAHWIGDNNASSVWEVSLDKGVEGSHPTQKPVELFTRAIGNHQGDVYDPFAGSGTCVIACEKLERRCFAMEITPDYCDVILQRWELFADAKAERVDG